MVILLCYISAFSEVIYADFYDKILDWNFRLVDENSQILVVVFITTLNFSFSCRFTDENCRIFVVVIIFVTKINLFLSPKIFVFVVVDKKTLLQVLMFDVFWQESTSRGSAGSIELFADVPHKPRQRQRHSNTERADIVPQVGKKKNKPCQRQRDAATGPADSVTQVGKKKNSRKPPGRKLSPVEQPQTRKLPSFSEFYNYSLVIEGNSGDDGGGDRASVGEKEAKVDRDEKLCVGWNVEALSQATSELCELSCQHHSGRCSAVTHECHDTSTVHDGLKTSTPHPLSTANVSDMIGKELVECTSRLQLFSSSSDAVFGMCQCLFRPFSVSWL